MSKKILVVACLVVMITVFTGCDLLGGDKNREATKEETNAEQNQENNKESDKDEAKEESFFGSMQDLIMRGKSLKCTYRQNSDDGEYEVVTYISGGNVKTEAEMKTGEGKTMESSMVINKDWMYMWNSFTPKGMKVDMQKMPEIENVTDNDVNKDMANLAKEMDYKCRPWIPDNSKFKIPADIQFQDITEMMAGMTEGLGDMTEGDISDLKDEANKFLCEHCKNAPDPAECLGDVVCE